VLSTSKAAAGIKSREFAGWDDPRLGTLRALRRRGFQAKAIVNLIHDIGPNTADVSISMSTLAAQNKQLVDFDANRHFFVSDPVRIKVSNPAKVGMIELPLHPDDEKRGVRKIKVGEHFFIERADFKKFEGHEVRLKELYNVIIYKSAECTGEKVLQKMPKIQWVPQEDKISVNVVMPDAKIIKGVGEPAIAKEKVGAVIQFQRFGFVRIDSVSKECVTCYFGHK
jgi:glutamyl-tRNA synthetase